MSLNIYTNINNNIIILHTKMVIIDFSENNKN